MAIESASPIEPGALAAAVKPVFRDFPRAHFHFVAALPRNDNGKIQRYVLKQQLMSGAMSPGRTGEQAAAIPHG